MAGKYSALEQYLRSLPARQRGVILTFEEIEKILNSKLPRSAYVYVKWWTQERHPRSPQKQALIRAGWRLSTISMSEQWLQFIREEQAVSRPAGDGSLQIPGGYSSLENLGED